MPKPKKRRRRKLLIAAVLLLAIGGGLAWKLLHKPAEVVAVQVEKVGRRDLTETVVANGRIQPVTQVMISPEVAGEIIALPVKEGQEVKKGDVLVQIKPDNYQASKNSAEASFKAALGNRSQAKAELEKAAADFRRNEELFKGKLISASVFNEVKTLYEVAGLRLENSLHQADQARFAMDKANDDLAKTTIASPIDGTITKLKSQLGERVLGTSFNMGTEMMTVGRLDEMEARVDIGEIDVVLIQEGQTARIEVDAFKDRKFKGTVTAIANASKGSSANPLSSSGSANQEAPKFEVRIRVLDREAFRPGMSVTAEIETRSRTGVLAVPIGSVTTRLPGAGGAVAKAAAESGGDAVAAGRPPEGKAPAPVKPAEVVFALEGDHAKMIAVKTGISDSDFFEIAEGLSEGQQIITGGYKAVSKDLEDGKKVTAGAEAGKGGSGVPGKDAKP